MKTTLRMLVFLGVALLAAAPRLAALSLTADTDVGGGVLSGTNAAGAVENIRTNGADPTLFWWADTNGDNVATDPASAGLNLGAYSLTRGQDRIGFTLNLNSGSADSAITWGGVTGGSISTRRPSGSDKNGSPITIRGVTDIACYELNSSGFGTGNGAPLTVVQSGCLTATNILAQPAYQYTSGAAISLSGAGRSAGIPAGWLQVGSTIANNGITGASAILVRGYDKVTVGAGGINSSQFSGVANDVGVINIGTGGVSVAGDILTPTIDQYGGGNVTIATLGDVKIGRVDTHRGNPSGAWVATDAGSVRLTAGGNVDVTGALETYMLGNGQSYSRNAGNVLVTSASGHVNLNSINATNLVSQSGYNCYAGSVAVTSRLDIAISGTINLFAGRSGAYRGSLALVTTGSITLNTLDLANLSVATFDGGAGWGQVTNALANFDTTHGGGSGTFASPYAASQTQLRAPAGKRIYYGYAPGLLNNYLGGFVYQLPNLDNSGPGGILMTRLAGAPDIYNVGPANVQTTSADLVGNLAAGAPATVTCYWGISDGGTVAGNWQHVTTTVVSATGYVTNNVTGLVVGTLYYFRYYATNASGDLWAPDTLAFSPTETPAVNNASGATALLQNGATLNGALTAGGSATTVWIYWGTADGNTNKTGWNRPLLLVGQPGLASFAAAVNYLYANQACWYRCYASNTAGEAWAPSSASFTTASPVLTIGSLSLPEGGQGTNTAAVLPIALTASSMLPMSLAYATAPGANAVAGVDYVPASGTLNIPAGVTATQLAVTVIGNNIYEWTKTVLMNLASPTAVTLGNTQGVVTIVNDDWTVHVRGDGQGSDSNIGGTWTNALATLGKAISLVPRPYNLAWTRPADTTTSMRILVQASGGAQTYDPMFVTGGNNGNNGATIDVDIEGGWVYAAGAWAQTGLSVVNGGGTNAGLHTEGGGHASWKRVTLNRFLFTNVTHGVEMLQNSDDDHADNLLYAGNLRIYAASNGLYISYPKPYTGTYGGAAQLQANNVEIHAGAGAVSNTYGIYVSGQWNGSSIGAGGTNPATGAPWVSSVTCAGGCGVFLSAFNNETPFAACSNLVVYGCASNGISLDAAQPDYASTIGSNRVQLLLSHCTIVDNAGDGVQVRSQTAGSWVAATNCIFANNGGHGINLVGGPVFGSAEDYNVLFNDDVYSNGVSQAAGAHTSTFDPLLFSQRTRPSPWYLIRSGASPAYKRASDGANRGAYQESRIPGATVIVIL